MFESAAEGLPFGPSMRIRRSSRPLPAMSRMRLPVWIAVSVYLLVDIIRKRLALRASTHIHAIVIVDGVGVGNDHPHRLEAQALEIGDIVIDIFDRDV
jgi:hypothetical protein